MAKRLSQKNTLLNYFQSPKQTKRPVKPEEQEQPPENDDSDEDVPLVRKKRSCRIIDSDSDSENNESCVSVKRAKIDSDGVTPKKGKFQSPAVTPKSKLKDLDKFKYSSPSTSSKNVTKTVVAESSPAEGRWKHDTFTFLQPDKIRDINRNRPSDPNYDPRTLFVPADFLTSLTPAMKQWWDMKSRHYDCVLFFKVGKFYELYHMDAVTGVNHLGFTYMKGDFAHSGFPETAYGKMASSLIEQGFKVARVEQTETPQMMTERCKETGRSTKFDKVVRREICEVSEKGAFLLGAQVTKATSAHSFYLMSIVEKVEDNKIRFGVCFIDTTIGIFHLGEFEDDLLCSRLLTLFSEHRPALILTERGRLSDYTNNILKKSFTEIKRELLIPDKQFYSANKVIEIFNTECYFKNENHDVNIPPFLQSLIDDGYPKLGYNLMLHALGGIMWYLKYALIDIQLLSMGNFEHYYPVDAVESTKVSENKHMVLDCTTLENLKILGGLGSLQNTLDFCSTPFGKRMLQNWICRPLCILEHIIERQDAVKELYENTELLMSIRDLMSKLPDLERQIAKINIFGNRQCATEHPDSRAILYESKQYTKRKILDLLETLEAFKLCSEIPKLFEDCECKLLKKLTQILPSGAFQDVTETLDFFEEAFDHDSAKKKGCIIPAMGVDDDYDASERKIKEVEDQLAVYLKQQSKHFKCELRYFGNDKKRYQIEVPASNCRLVNSTYNLESTRKGAKPVNRYSTERTRKLLADMMQAESQRSKILHDLNRRVFEKFGKKYNEWIQIILNVSMLDCICSLAEYARRSFEDICLPKMHEFSDKPFCSIENGKHPCIKNIGNFVPNDTDFGIDEKANIIILTGPNMGGKSTLMRQVVLISIMAQIGSFVPATSCEMSLADRVFTRLGAHDEIMKHRSTFLVEMQEAASILKHATLHSFVLIDELGRGTSTHDGNAIATAYVKKLCDINCRTIFSTHYHTLVEYYQNQKDIQLGYMTCLVENEGDIAERVTFLYKMQHGICPKSYGFNVAKLAGLSTNIVERAGYYAAKFETVAKNRQAMVDLFTGDMETVGRCLARLTVR